MKQLSRNLSSLHPTGDLPFVSMGVPEDFRGRLRSAVERAGRKAVAREDGRHRGRNDDSVSQGGLSKILSGERGNPGIFTIKAIANSAGVTVGELLGESGFEVTTGDQEEVRRFVRWAELKLLKSAPPKLDATPNAAPLRITLVEAPTGNAQPRRAKVVQLDAKRTAKRFQAAAGPRETYTDGDVPEREIPSHYYELGARLVFRTDGDSMMPGFLDRDLLFVRPETDPAKASGKNVVAKVDGAPYVKRLDVSSGVVRLVSTNERYEPMVVDEETQRFELVGVVVGRSGYPPE